MPKITIKLKSIHIGVDPGLGGGISCIITNSLNKREYLYTEMPDTERDLFEFLKTIPDCDYKMALVEKVHAMPGNGVSAMFTFGRNYGQVTMALTCMKIPFRLSPPVEWQRQLKLPPKKPEQSKSQWKRSLVTQAQRRMPDVPIWSIPGKVTYKDKLADSLLIAQACFEFYPFQ